MLFLVDDIVSVCVDVRESMCTDCWCSLNILLDISRVNKLTVLVHLP